MPIPLYEPLNTLKQIAGNIWVVDGPVIHMDVLRIGIPFSTRMTIVKLQDGSLWCHSPIAPNQQLFKEINQLGEVKYLISPNKLHYAYIKEWQKQYPEAYSWASPGVEKRAQSQNIETHFDYLLEDQPPLEWKNSIEQFIFKGSSVIEEVVFFHTSSQTLILTDLIENFETDKISSYFWKNIYKLAGIAHPDGKMPIDMRLTFIGNKAEARKSYEQLLKWEPEKIIIAHGKWFERNGTEELKRAFRWLN